MRPRPSIRRPSGRRPSLAIGLLASPVIRRVAWHLRRVSGTLDRRFYATLAQGILGFVAVAAVAITLAPLEMRDAMAVPRTASVVPSA